MRRLDGHAPGAETNGQIVMVFKLVCPFFELRAIRFYDRPLKAFFHHGQKVAHDEYGEIHGDLIMGPVVVPRPRVAVTPLNFKIKSKQAGSRP